MNVLHIVFFYLSNYFQYEFLKLSEYKYVSCQCQRLFSRQRQSVSQVIM